MLDTVMKEAADEILDYVMTNHNIELDLYNVTNILKYVLDPVIRDIIDGFPLEAA